jgi:hypothetical protein
VGRVCVPLTVNLEFLPGCPSVHCGHCMACTVSETHTPPPLSHRTDFHRCPRTSQYDKYIEEFRNLTYLENQVERLQQEDEDQFAHAMSQRDAASEAAGYV